MVRTSFEPIPIVVRRVRLEFDDVEDTFFFGGNAVLSALIAAVSATFPPGEAAFIRAVRGCVDRVEDEALLQQVKQFSTQEGHHAHQHKALNQALDRLGFAVTEASQEFDRLIHERTAQREEPLEHLAATVAMEHLTASMAHFILHHPEHIQAMPASIQNLLFWHAIEEIEHKSVAFDVFIQAGGSRRLLRIAMFVQLLRFVGDVNRMRRKMLRDMGHRSTWSERLEAARWMLGRKGLLPNIAGHVADLLRSDFEPWDVDDRALVEAWKERLSAI